MTHFYYVYAVFVFASESRSKAPLAEPDTPPS